MHILALSKSFEGSQPEVRLKRPLLTWEEKYQGHVRFCNFSQVSQSLLSWADIIIFARHLIPLTVDLIHAARVLNKKIIYDVDDNFFSLPPHLQHHSAALSAYPQMADALIPYVDFVLASTNTLSHQFKHLTDSLAVIPNGVDTSDLRPIYIQQPFTKVTLLLAATDLMPLDFLLPALKSIQAHYGESVALVVIGPNAALLRNAGISFTEKSALSYHAFHNYLRTLINPIGLIPLDSSAFSACKTPVKFMDYTIAGIPVICSDVMPFSEILVSHEHALLAINETAQWAANMQCLIDNLDTRQALVLNAQTLVHQHYSKDKLASSYQQLFLSIAQGGQSMHGPVRPSMSFLKRIQVKASFYITHLLNMQSYLVMIKKLKASLIAN